MLQSAGQAEQRLTAKDVVKPLSEKAPAPKRPLRRATFPPDAAAIAQHGSPSPARLHHPLMGWGVPVPPGGAPDAVKRRTLLQPLPPALQTALLPLAKCSGAESWCDTRILILKVFINKPDSLQLTQTSQSGTKQTC